LGRFLIVLGLVIAAVGVLVSFGLPLGRLPGDVVIRRGHTSIHFPIVTSIVVSLLLTLLLGLFRR
jgi:hypothetical protein